MSRRAPAFCAGFGWAHADRSVVAVLTLFAVILSSLLIGYAERDAWLTRVVAPRGAAPRPGNNSHIYFRDAPLYAEKNLSAVAAAREPALVVALEKLRLALAAGGAGDAGAHSVGETRGGAWRRRAALGALWRALLARAGDVRHACHVGLGGGFAALTYLEALPNASVALYAACGGAARAACDALEAHAAAAYAPGRFALHRANAPARALVRDVRGAFFDVDAALDHLPQPPRVKPGRAAVLSDSSGQGARRADTRFPDEPEYKSVASVRRRAAVGDGFHLAGQANATGTRGETVQVKTVLDNDGKPRSPRCDWIGVELRGDDDVDVDLLSVLSMAAACPNTLFMNNIGRETQNEQLANVAQAWEAGIEQRVSMQSHCGLCYEDESDCTYCFGELLCGAVAAAAQQELAMERMDDEASEEESSANTGAAEEKQADDAVQDAAHTASSDSDSETRSDTERREYDEEEDEKQEELESALDDEAKAPQANK